LRKARVVHIITKLELGGAQQNTLYTVSHLDRGLFEPVLVSGEPGILDDEARSLGVEFHRVPQLVRKVRPHLEIAAAARLMLLLRRIRKREPRLPVIVHTHSSKAGILGRWAAYMSGCEFIIHTYHGFGFHDWQSAPAHFLFKWAERVTRPLTDAFVCVSRNNIEKGKKEKVLRGKDTCLIRSGIEIDKFSSEGKDIRAIKESIGVPPQAPLAGMISNFKPQKSPVDFVEIAGLVSEKMPEAHFFIAGDGELRPEVERKVRELGIKDRFHLLGWRRDVPELMAAADIVVLTSLFEGLPRVVLQAMAARRPVVATCVDGTPEAVTDGITGFLARPRDIETMARRIAELLGDAGLRRKMGEEAAKRVGEFDIDKMVRDQEDLYLKLLEGKGL